MNSTDFFLSLFGLKWNPVISGHQPDCWPASGCLSSPENQREFSSSLYLYFYLSFRSYLGKPQFPPSQPGCLQFSLWEVEFPGNDARDLLLPGDPVQRHLGPHVVIQGPVTVVLDHLLPAALPLPHCLQRAVPVQQLEDRHDLLELQHGLPEVLVEHESVSPDAWAWLGLRSNSLDLLNYIVIIVLIFI